jgi:hypothetical protein
MRLNRIGLGLLALTASMGLVACDSSDNFETFTATCEGRQENPAVNSGGTCQATVLLSKTLDRADVSIQMSGLNNVTQAHIHRAPAGTNGPVIFWLWQPNNPLYPASPEQLGKLWTSPTIDSRDESFSQRIIDDLRAGNLYVNFHTTQFPGGEIRGQLRRQ